MPSIPVLLTAGRSAWPLAEFSAELYKGDGSEETGVSVGRYNKDKQSLRFIMLLLQSSTSCGGQLHLWYVSIYLILLMPYTIHAFGVRCANYFDTGFCSFPGFQDALFLYLSWADIEEGTELWHSMEVGFLSQSLTARLVQKIGWDDFF
eukprot:s4259_g2.t1